MPRQCAILENVYHLDHYEGQVCDSLVRGTRVCGAKAKYWSQNSQLDIQYSCGREVHRNDLWVHARGKEAPWRPM